MVVVDRGLRALDGTAIEGGEAVVDPLRERKELKGNLARKRRKVQKTSRSGELQWCKERILSWNVRGVNDSEKRKVVKALIKCHKADLVCLQKTKMQEIVDKDSRSLGGVVTFTGSGSGNVFNLLSVQELGLWGGPYCVAGEFNVIRFPMECSRGGKLNSTMRRFFEIIEDLKLRDLPLQGGHFTRVVQCVLLKPISDHSPILLDWEGEGGEGGVGFCLRAKLKALKPLLREWNKNVFGKVEVNKALALNQVEFWDKVEVARPLVVRELEARREGGRNTRFFHKMANAHMRSLMARVKINGVWSTEENEIREGVVNEFKLLLSTAGGWRPSISGLSFPRLEAVDRARLEEPFSKQEVFKALKGFSGNKAPKPDGFSMAFWQSSWGFVKEEVMGFFREFHDHNCFVKSLNTTFIVLIPKKGGTEDLRDFRPISLVDRLYKWLAKVLANRLKLLVGKVVSKAQNAFVKGRQILDAALVANGVIDSILKSNEGVVLCKLDIEKAYDHVD
ncbi:Transposon TX1 uncharacterized 149 kDa protein [Vitis vinifera]|uniref:Transposon TX1 uncharacterized 149 kDa protein n=1 Tax=Vitis vinifera TaxID=29760 RepID=A0A438H5D3_VITVI|nr:Transposon TX1 uncharacterized 149 kDa protein [Vitis vinifera]